MLPRDTHHSKLPRGGALRTSRKVLPEHARRHNRSLVLQSLYHDGNRSRAEIARQTGLTRVTVSDLVAELIAEGILVELGQQEGTRPGKPAVLLGIDRAAFQVIGVDLSEHDRLVAALMDLDGTITRRAEVMLDAALGDAALVKLKELVRGLVAEADLPLLGVGVGSPGVVNLDGTVLTSTKFGWELLPLQEELQAFTGLPVVVANDANVAALAEYSLGESAGDVMLVKIGHGIGAGLVIADSLVHGSRFAAGEIGRIVVGTDEGIDSGYSPHRVLESWLAVPNLEAAVAAAGPEGREEALREAGRRLGVVLAPIVGALNLSEIALSGPTELLDGPLAEATIDTIRARSMPEASADLALRMTTLGRDIVLRGAAVMVVSAQWGVS